MPRRPLGLHLGHATADAGPEIDTIENTARAFPRRAHRSTRTHGVHGKSTRFSYLFSMVRTPLNDDVRLAAVVNPMSLQRVQPIKRRLQHGYREGNAIA